MVKSDPYFHDPDRRVRFYFRIQKISLAAIGDLREIFGPSAVITNKKQSVAVLRLNAKSCEKLCRFIVDHRILKKNYRIGISIVTQQYSDGTLVPAYVLRLACRFGCSMSF